MNKTNHFLEDLEYVSEVKFIPWDRLKNKTILITGATGLIGYTLTNSLIYVNKKRKLNLNILVLVRDINRAKERFKEFASDDALEYVIGNVEEPFNCDKNVDYIVHGAGQTASKSFVNQPVETILTALKGTENLLRFAKEKKIYGMVYLSSMEVYGQPERGHKVTEDEIGRLSPLDVRNSYPISKLQCENLCNAYACEYSIPVKTVRLTQTFGPGVEYSDARVFAEFARCLHEKKNIVLQSSGETERCYLYTMDAVTAILTVLLKGNSGEVYNVASEHTYCSIMEMAKRVAKIGQIKVCVDLQNKIEMGHLTTHYMYLDTNRLKALGWISIWNDCVDALENMYIRMIKMM